MDEAKLAKLKQLVQALEYSGDDLAFDRLLSEIDLVIFDLRQECFVPHQAYVVPRLDISTLFPEPQVNIKRRRL